MPGLKDGQPLTLDLLPLGESATVASVDSDAALAERLEDLGFVPGTVVVVRRRAPLGDPRVYELRGSQLCLRANEARAVRVTRG
ncbi:MAG: ferrous iron transport protein A [Deltaproteobacteria bacterium]|nr:ferrous iron transport protein A [Deltaproteobacteria bacterium]